MAWKSRVSAGICETGRGTALARPWCIQEFVMFSKSLAIGALAAGCVAAAAGGAYVAVRHNAGIEPVAATASLDPPAKPVDALKPVAETEAVVSSPVDGPKTESDAPSRRAAEEREAVKPVPEKTVKRSGRTHAARSERTAAPPATARPRPSSRPESTAEVPRETREPVAEPAVAAPPTAVNLPSRVDPAPQLPAEVTPPTPQLEELVVPSSSVIGLRVDTALSSERAGVEDRVDARVTRDVMVDGRVAIPSGTRAIGSVILVERGGKMRDRARLGVRFHTLVLSNGSELPINTEAIYREGDSPSGESARKIGGAAVGGAILGALIGGKKGAVVGGATGAAGGTAVVMAGDRNAATLPSGTVVTIHLAAPVGVEVEKR
jgi:type IV secretory pathway VirB10-like protein